MPPPTFRRLVGAVGVCVVLLSGCSDDAAVGSSPTVTPPPDDPRGTIVESAPFSTTEPKLLDSGAVLRTIRYRSTSGIDNSPSEVSGVIAVPPGDAPAGGWPIISFGHGTTGIRTECGPSLSADLKQTGEFVGAFASLGYVVVMSDYQGLGYGTGHRYLEPRTEAFNLIDAARAARYLVPNTSPDWVAYGLSQGGQAAWAAHDLAPIYGGQTPLNLVGTVALSPVADVTSYATGARDEDLTAEEKGLYAMLVTSWADHDPSVTTSDYLRNSATDERLTGCASDNPPEAASKVVDEDVVPDDAAYAALEYYTSSISLPSPGAKPTSPMQVIYGLEDTVVSADSTRGAIEKACAQGDSITAVPQPGRGHAVDPSPTVQWVADRFAGKEALSTC